MQNNTAKSCLLKLLVHDGFMLFVPERPCRNAKDINPFAAYV